VPWRIAIPSINGENMITIKNRTAIPSLKQREYDHNKVERI